jgi:hypothetical protein
VSIFKQMQLEREFASRIHHPQYHQPDDQEDIMGLLDTVRTEITGAVTWGEDEFRAHLPTVAALADQADAVAASAPAQAVLGAVLSPEDEAFVVGLVQRLDQRLHGLTGGMPAGSQPPAEAPAA